jgi:hypothetical protein
MTMETLASALRKRLADMPEDGCLGEYGNRAHLEWMITTAEGSGTWPRDKRVRWMGYVAGAVDCASGGGRPSVSRMVDTECGALSRQDARHERILFAGIDEVLEWLEAACEEKGRTDGVELVSAARRSETAAKASYCLGYIQAFMAAWKILDIDAERDRTRTIFHRVYAQCGYAIPETTDRTPTADGERSDA